MENLKMTFMVTYIVYGEPIGKGRPRFARRGAFTHAYTPEKTKTYEDEIRYMARAAMGASPPLETPVTVAIYIRVEIPKSFSKQKRKDAIEGILKPTKKPDIDNVAKCHLDAIQGGIIILDDKQVTNLHVTKVYAETPAVEVMVKEDLI
jgi:Holliday junction resolvase RusA-like endonuclease